MLFLMHQPDTGGVGITSCPCRRIRVLLKVLVLQDIFEDHRPPLVLPRLQLCVPHELLREELSFSVYELQRNGMHPKLDFRSQIILHFPCT